MGGTVAEELDSGQVSVKPDELCQTPASKIVSMNIPETVFGLDTCTWTPVCHDKQPESYRRCLRLTIMSLLYEQLRDEADVSITCNGKIDFSAGVHTADKSGTIWDSHHSISEHNGCKKPASDSLGKRPRVIQNTFAKLVPEDLLRPTEANSAEAVNRLLVRILPGVVLRVCGLPPTTIRIVKSEYKRFGELTPGGVENEGLPQFDTHDNAIPLDKKIILLRHIISPFSGEISQDVSILSSITKCL